jgi:hypothetical protein
MFLTKAHKLLCKIIFIYFVFWFFSYLDYNF